MAFVRRRGNNTTLIETYREGDKVEQRLIANLYGQNSVAEDLQELERQIAEPEQWLRGNPYDDPNDISDRRQPLFSYIDENGNEAIHFSYSQLRRKTREHERRERRIARLQEEEDRERLLTFTSPLPTP